MARLVVLAFCVAVTPIQAFRLGKRDADLAFGQPVMVQLQEAAPDFQEVISGFADLDSLTDAAQKLLDSAKALQDIKEQWDTLLKSLEQAKSAAYAAVIAGEAMGVKISNISSNMSELGLDALLDGSIGLDDLKGLHSLYDEPQSVRSAIKTMLSCTDELSHLSKAVEGLLGVMNGIQELVASVEELAPAFIDVPTGILDTLVNQTEAVYQRIIAAETDMKATDAALGPVLEELKPDQYWTTMYHLATYSEEIKTGFKTLGTLWDNVTEAHAAATPIIAEMKAQVISLHTASSAYQLPSPSEDPSEPSASEPIASALCSARRTGIMAGRMFPMDRTVDATMSCIPIPFLGKKYCRCVRSTDCYVESENRPEPKNVKRCFSPVD